MRKSRDKMNHTLLQNLVQIETKSERLVKREEQYDVMGYEVE